MKRSIRVQQSDAYGSWDNLRSLYDALYVYPAVQVESMLMSGPGDAKYMFRVASMAAAGFCPRTAGLSPDQRQVVSACVKTYKERIRRLQQVGDVYHVFPRPDGVQWTGIQYVDPATGRGVVYIFKPDKGADRWTIRLRGLDPAKSYRLEFEDGSNPAVVLSGRVLAESGVEIALPGNTYRSELMFLVMHDR